jgi:hypothetical protein
VLDADNEYYDIRNINCKFLLGLKVSLKGLSVRLMLTVSDSTIRSVFLCLKFKSRKKSLFPHIKHEGQ